MNGSNQLLLMLARRYFSTESGERLLAIGFLGEVGLKFPPLRMQVATLLMRGLIDKDIPCQASATHYLGELGWASAEIAAHLVYPLTMLLLSPGTSPLVEYNVLIALEKLDKSSEDVVQYLERGMADVGYLEAARLFSQDPRERGAATWKLGKIGAIHLPAIIDLIPVLLGKLVDDDETVRKVASIVITRLASQHGVKMLELALDFMSTKDARVKVAVYDVFDDHVRHQPGSMTVLIGPAIRDLMHSTRELYVRVHKLLRLFERLSPAVFLNEPSLLVSALCSQNRNAYHWAVGYFTSTFLPRFREEGAQDPLAFIDRVTAFLSLLAKLSNENVMQTRVILMMLVHEVKELFTLNSPRLASTPLKNGFIESLSRIQESSLSSDTEVMAAYERFSTILSNSRQFLFNTGRD